MGLDKLLFNEKSYKELITLRGEAINAYAMLEQSLASLLAVLGDIKPKVASTIFFKTVNTRYRNEILTKLKKEKFGSEYSEFWNSAMKMVNELNETRNQIVHWHMINKVSFEEGREPNAISVITPPNLYSGSKAKLTSDDLIDFISKARFVSGHLQTFLIRARNPEAWDKEHPSHNTFQRALTYPPPQPDHSPSQTNKE